MDNEQDIAIVGMSCRLPGAGDLDQFWRNLAAGVESITRWADEETAPGYVNAAPVLDDPAGFDAAFFGYSPAEARTIDPQQRILLELAHEALEHAGHDPARYAGRVGVYAGSALNTYYAHAGLHTRIAEDYIPTLIANDKDFLATRISYKLNLKGPSMTVQTACSTSLVAVHLARQGLLCGEIDMALVGAISVRVPHRAGYLYDGSGVVSPDGRVRAFDARANGTVFGSGGGVLVLKRLADALAEGDCIHAVIKGSAVNNDGSEKAGYSAPSVAAQADAVVEALANAGIDADSVSYVEAHGSGTPVGDPIEVTALTRAFRAFTQRSGYCALGSVKTNLGHLDAAAGLAGIIKTVLALKHRQIPPSLHYSEPNPEIDFLSTPFYVNTELKPWTGDGPRRAGVMATGMGGTNAHVVLEESPPSLDSTIDHGPQVLQLSAKTSGALEQAAERLRNFLQKDSSSLADVAHTLRVGRKAFAHRGYMVCASREAALEAKLHYGKAGDTHRPVVLLLPGMGDQYVGMGRGLYEGRPVFRQEVDRCAAILQPLLGRDIREVLYPSEQSSKPSGKGIDFRRMLQRATTLRETLVAQPALFTVEYALARLWQSLGVVPGAIVGHSMGEYVAACLAGVMPLEGALRLLVARAKLVSALPEAAMLAVTMPEQELTALLPPGVCICLVNGPNLCVVAGPPAAVADLEAKSGQTCRRVQNAHAFHSKLLEPIAKPLEQEARQVRLEAPKIPYISNVTGTWIKPEEATDPAYWALHATRTARFGDALRELWQLPEPVLLEAGPGRTLGVLAQSHPERPPGAGAAVIASMRHDYENQPDAEVLCHAAGKLWLSGIPIKEEERERRRVALPTYPFERQDCWIGQQDSSEVRKKRDPAEWFYLPSWRRTLPPAAAEHKPARWLVFGDPRGLVEQGEEVVKVEAGSRFERRDAHSFTIDPAQPRHYEDLLRAVKAPERIVYAWSDLYGLLFVARALGAHYAGQDVQLAAVSTDLELDPEKAMLLGPLVVMRQEYPNIRVKSIDVDAASFSFLAGELRAWDDNVLVAYRNGERWVRSYEPVKPPLARPAFRQRGVYLITGASGRIGRAIAQYLREKYDARLVLVGRSAQALEGYFQADVADEEAMRAAVAHTYKRYGALHGVIHAAGVIGEAAYREIKEADPSSCEAQFNAKVHGVRVLESVLEGQPLDFCLLMSSLAGLLGGIGQAAYAAANLYMDAFARRHNRSGGTPWLSVNWDVWRFDDASAFGSQLGTTLKDFGMSTGEAMQALETALALRGAGQLVVSTGDLGARIDQWVNLESLKKENFIAKAAAPRRVGYEPPRDEVERAICRIWRDTLGLEEVGIHDSFFELGGHSLLAIRIVVELRKAFRLDLPVRTLFDAPTPEKLARCIQGLALMEKPEAEANREEIEL
jgi:phthiocerol/phenolphthiocerol synthesis type-I polyketide synthase E